MPATGQGRGCRCRLVRPLAEPCGCVRLRAISSENTDVENRRLPMKSRQMSNHTRRSPAARRRNARGLVVDVWAVGCGGKKEPTRVASGGPCRLDVVVGRQLVTTS
jgi:hypothetical protein